MLNIVNWTALLEKLKLLKIGFFFLMKIALANEKNKY